MNVPDQDYDKQKLRILSSAVMDGTATESGMKELTALLRESAAARDEYLTFVDLHANLATELASTSSTMEVQQPGSVEHPKRVTTLASRKWLLIAAVAALAACIMIAVIPFMSDEPDDESDSPFATVVHVSNAESGSGRVEVGTRFGCETIHLESGFLRLVFDDGVEVTLQGPAEYELLAAGRTRLKSGLLTALVPPGAEGFTVDTPTAEVVDLGTAFGIDLQEDGISHVSVFEGEVEVSTPDSAETKLLKEGEAVRIANGETIESVEFDPEPFTKVWPIASGIEKSTDAFRFVPPWPPQQRFVRSDDDIFIVPEGHVATLSSSLRVNVSSPGTYSQSENLTATELSQGQRIRSFTLFFHPEKAGPRQPEKQVTGSITFDSPVLGLIVLREELQASARRFIRKGPRNVREGQQLELTGDENGDVITISEDRRTVTLQLSSPGRSSELMRVIVDASRQTSKE